MGTPLNTDQYEAVMAAMQMAWHIATTGTNPPKLTHGWCVVGDKEVGYYSDEQAAMLAALGHEDSAVLDVAGVAIRALGIMPVVMGLNDDGCFFVQRSIVST